MKFLEIYTDGACSGNPGPGGWGAVIISNSSSNINELCGGEAHTTNNRMELMGAIKALEYLNEQYKIKLYTDSKYLKDGITNWIHNWKRNNWRNASKQLVKNSDLWQELDKLASNHEIEWIWVKAHSGNLYNEQADKLAVKGIKNNQG